MKYLELYHSLRADILSGKLGPNAQLPFCTELMRQYRLSNRTVGHALKLLQQEGLVRTIRSKGTFVLDRETAFPYINGKDGIQRVAVLVLYRTTTAMHMVSMREICKGIEEQLVRYQIRFYLLSAKDRTFQEVLRELNVLNIDAIITIDFFNTRLREQLEQLNTPLIHTDMLDPNCRYPVLVSDNMQGGAMIADRIHNRGHGGLLYINKKTPDNPMSDLMENMRFKGMRDRAVKHGMVVETYTCSYVPEGETVIRSEPELSEKLRQFRAVVFANPGLCKQHVPVLEAIPDRRAREMEYFVFWNRSAPLLVKRKPVTFCSWDSREMGKRAALTLLGKNRDKARVQLLPMFLQNGM